ncbi:MAG TPA: ArgE/DapE family deacylase [Nitriliruptorales bacterium]
MADLASRVLAVLTPEAIGQTLMELVALPTVSANETPGQEHVAAWLDDAGLSVDRWTFSTGALEGDPWFSTEFERRDPVGVAGSTGGDDGPALLLIGHIDVVPPGRPESWTTPPFEPSIRDGRVHGRGACDMKGGLAAQLHAVKAIVDAGVELRGRVTVASVVGEEDGGCGTLALLEHGVRGDAAIICEPTELTVAPAVAGALTFEIEVEGLSAHGCLREEGVSAIERMLPIHRAVLELEGRRNARAAEPLFDWLERPFAICMGRISGGDWPSSEADWCRVEGRYGVTPDEDLEVARAELEQAVAAAARTDRWLRAHPPQVRWPGAQFFPARTAVDAPVVRTVCAAHAAEVGDPVVRGMPYGCDMGITVGHSGIPTVVYGPGDIRQAHGPDEWVEFDDVVTCSRALVRTILDFCGVA